MTLTARCCILVLKNLRISGIAIMQSNLSPQLQRREIVVRETLRFHCLKEAMSLWVFLTFKSYFLPCMSLFCILRYQFHLNLTRSILLVICFSSGFSLRENNKKRSVRIIVDYLVIVWIPTCIDTMLLAQHEYRRW